MVEQPEVHSNPALSLQERVMFDPETHDRQERDESSRVQDRLLLSDLQDQHMSQSTYAVSTTGWIWIKFTITILTAQGKTTSTALLQLRSYGTSVYLGRYEPVWFPLEALTSIAVSCNPSAQTYEIALHCTLSYLLLNKKLIS